MEKKYDFIINIINNYGGNIQYSILIENFRNVFGLSSDYDFLKIIALLKITDIITIDNNWLMINRDIFLKLVEGI